MSFAVEIELGGAKRRLALDLNAQIAFHEATGQDIITLGASLADKNISVAQRFRTMRLIVWGLLASDNPQFESDPNSKSVVGSWLDLDDLPRLAEVIGPLLEAYASQLGKRAREFPEQMAPFVPTPMPVARRMVALAGLEPGKVAVDLGAGDGRLLVAALEEGAFVTGYELHQGRFEALRAKIAARPDSDRSGVVRDDIRLALISHADVVFMYLLPGANEELKPKILAECKPGALVISHDFTFSDWEPETVERIEAEDRTHTVYVYRVPTPA